MMALDGHAECVPRSREEHQLLHEEGKSPKTGFGCLPEEIPAKITKELLLEFQKRTAAGISDETFRGVPKETGFGAERKPEGTLV